MSDASDDFSPEFFLDHLHIYTVVTDDADWKELIKTHDQARWCFDKQCSAPVPANVAREEYAQTIYTEWGWQGAGRSVTPQSFPTLVHRVYI